MTKKIFFDANILVDLINEEYKANEPTIYLFNKLCNNNDHLYCSPTSFANTYYFLSKAIRDTNLLNEKSIRFFSQFQFTREDSSTIDKVKKSKFRDLEDALQYYSAEDSKMDVIITSNYFDLEHSKILCITLWNTSINFSYNFNCTCPSSNKTNPLKFQPQTEN